MMQTKTADIKESATQKDTNNYGNSVVDSQDHISFTLFTKQNGGITKKISKNANGELIKDASNCWIANGIGQVIDIPFSKFAKFLNTMTCNKAISHGIPKNKRLPEMFPVVSAKKLNGTADTVARNLEFFEYPPNTNFILMIDYDPKSGTQPLAPEKLIDAIAEILPEFKFAAKLTTRSTSSCISDDKGQEVTGASSGYHIYFIVPPGTNVPRFREIFRVRTWLNRHGYISISKSGSMLTRNCLFDEFVMSPERLDFVAGAMIPYGWTQNRPDMDYIPGEIFDPGVLPDLMNDEKARCEILINDAKASVADEAKEIREKYISISADVMHGKYPFIPLKKCEVTIRAACKNKDLYADFLIFPDGMESVTVGHILKQPDKYDRVTCGDPLEPENTAGKARIFINQGKGKAVINSFLHGAHTFFLHPESAFYAEQTVCDILQWIADEKENRVILDEWIDKITGLNSTDVDTIKQEVHKKTGSKISNLNKDLKDQKSKNKKIIAKAVFEKKSQKRAKAGIKEIVYNPTETGKCCHSVSEVLRNHPEKKIYRFAGNLIKIINKQPSTVRMIKKIHDRGGKYPSMPTIVQFSNETLCHEVEKVAVCQLKDAENNIKDIAWPKNILTGVMALTECHEKPLVGIVEHPFIDDDFKPVLTQGYDDSTGLFKVFDVKPDIAFFKDSIHAFNYLANEVFQDFSFASKINLNAAISCLLTGMQRKLINDNTGCPGYLFTAPIQSSGKTTLCQLINYALYGRPAAASSYSDDDKEMAKHLLGILREGHSSVLFDNLSEGSVIESNELAKVITSDTYTNRLLSENKTATVPSSVLWLMTGNNVSVCGDFNTRFLAVELDTGDKNPDQLRFKRVDIEAWCERNRGKILGACMKVIMDGAGYVNHKLKPTRFKAWDKFVRNPIYKASNIDIADIFQNNKMSDPKIDGQRNFFEAWFNAFENKQMTAKQVLDHCTKVLDHDHDMVDAIKDIFPGENLPSTRSLGKWLAGMKNRFFGDYKFTSAGIGTNRAQSKQNIWVVEKNNE